MKIPECVNLTQEQQKVFEKWSETLILLDDYEDASMASTCTFYIYSTGLGDVILVTAQGKTLSLSYDDDGNIR